MQPHSATLRSQTPPSRISFPLRKPVIIAGSALSSLERFALEGKPEDELFWKISAGIERNPEQQLVSAGQGGKRRAPGSHWTEVFPQLKHAQKTESLHEDGNGASEEGYKGEAKKSSASCHHNPGRGGIHMGQWGEQQATAGKSTCCGDVVSTKMYPCASSPIPPFISLTSISFNLHLFIP